MVDRETYKEFLFEHIDFAIDYVSLHYPFSQEEIFANWNILSKGDAYYPVYMQDCEQVFKPALGLCYNGTIEWTDALKSRWKVGLWNPFIGQYEGLGEFPFDVSRWTSLIDELAHQQASSLYSGEEYPAIASGLAATLPSMKEYPTLSGTELAELYRVDRTTVLINPSIWHSTLSDILTPDTVGKLIIRKKELLRQADEAATRELEALGLSLDIDIEQPEPLPSNYDPNIPFSEGLKRTLRDIGFITDAEDEQQV